MTEDQKNYQLQVEAWLKEQDLVIKSNSIELSFLVKQNALNTERIKLLKEQIIFSGKLRASVKANLKKHMKLK
jgi:hypothetical protein